MKTLYYYSLSDNSKSCGKEGILGLYIEKEGIFLLLAVIVGRPVLVQE